MAKTLLHTSDYTFDKSSNVIYIKKNIQLHQFLLITDVTSHKVIYQFNNTLLGGSLTTTSDGYESILNLTYDTSSDVDILEDAILQIFYDEKEIHFEPSETLLDPVSKLRVSNPQNLVDTDFEYGLQSTKWETIQTVNNVPTLYSSSGDVPVEGVLSVISLAGSKQIKVTCNTPHNLSLGDPLSVQGVSEYQAEGFFVCSGVSSPLEFFFEIDVVASVSGEISGAYTTIVPAKFFEGSPLNIKNDGGAITDEANPSKLTVTTEETHGFTAGTKVYLRNTIGPKTLEIVDPTLQAPDGRPYIDTEAYFTTAETLQNTVTEAGTGRGSYLEPSIVAYDWVSTYNKWLTASDIDVTNNYITWPSHGMRNRYAVLFSTPKKGMTVSGLQDGRVYWVESINTNTIRLHTSENLGSIVDITAYDEEYGASRLGLCYKVEGTTGGYYRRTPINYFYNSGTGLSVGSSSYWSISGSGTSGSPYVGESTNRSINGNTAFINFTARANGSIVYNFSVSSESCCDFAVYYVNGVRYQRWAGSGTRTGSNAISNGQVVLLQFTKDGSVHRGGDRMYVNSLYNTGSLNISPNADQQNRSGFDLISTTYGLGGVNPQAVIGFQGITAGSYATALDSYTYLANQRTNGRYATVGRKYGNRTNSYRSNGNFYVNYYDNTHNYGTNSQVFYMFVNDLTSDRNTIYKENHGFLNGTVANVFVTPQQFADGERFSYADANGNEVFMPESFEATIIVVSDSVFKLQSNANPASDDILTYPDSYSVGYREDNDLYNTVYINNHKITGTSEAQYLVEGNNETSPETLLVSQGESDFIFNGTRLGRNELDPELVLYRGETYVFELNAEVTDNFYFTTNDFTSYVSGTYVGEYLTGVTNSRGTGGTSVTIVVDGTTPSTLYYAGGNIGDLFGTISIREAGTAIGGLINTTNYLLNRVNDSRLSLTQLTSTSASSLSSTIGAATNIQNTYSINVTSALGLNPTSASIQQVQFRGDFSSINEYVLIRFADGDEFFIGQQGGQDTDQFLIDEFFGNKNLTNVLYNSGGQIYFDVTVIPTSQVNFAPRTMTNWWELRFLLTGDSGVVNLTSGGLGIQEFVVKSLEGAYDGVFEMTSVDSTNSFKISTDFKVPSRKFEFDVSNLDFTDFFVTFLEPHNLITGEKVSYNNNNNPELGVFETDFANELYVIVVDELKIKFSSSYDGAINNNFIEFNLSIVGQTYNYSLSTLSVIKSIKGVGSVSFSQGSKDLIGSGTSFLTQYKRFDTIFISDGEFTRPYTINNVLTLETLTVFEDFITSGSNQSYFYQTEFVLRPDGYGIHLPFDGGVNITAGTSPDSKIVRQSRKYFRYQSGKGIQNSFAINFNPPKIVRDLIKADGVVAKVNTQESHNLKIGDSIVIEGAEVSSGENYFNGDFIVTDVSGPFQFQYEMFQIPQQLKAAGYPTYHRKNWTDSYVRAGMFDDQNGFFYEYDGTTLSACRRSSTLQLAGVVDTVQGSQVISGINTSFTSQVELGDFVVIRGQSYKIVDVSSDIRLVVQPKYRGVSAKKVKMTKTVDTKVPQHNWNIDACDGTGRYGYKLDINRIQMAYADYSWYGAGKIRFGFKDNNGHVKYVHEFKHNNILNESYFRSGNLPGRYEILNGPNASTAPTLFHFGTSIIMDGRFDDDKAYLISANSKPFAFTNGNSTLFNSNSVSTFQLVTLNGKRVWVYAIQTTNSIANTYRSGLVIKDTVAGVLPNGTYISQIQSIPGSSNSLIYTSYPATSTSPSSGLYGTFASSTQFRIGEEEVVDLTRPLPLISIRLAPSVDSSLTGKLGEREIVNRMQLALKKAGITSGGDCEIFIILNAQPSSLEFKKVGSPSLSEEIEHKAGDTLEGGTVIYSTKSSAGSVEIELGELLELGNSILGGDGVFPAGPDLLTLAIQPQNTSGVSVTSPFFATGKISWSESQA